MSKTLLSSLIVAAAAVAMAPLAHAQTKQFDPYSQGAKAGKADPYTDGARTVAGLDRSGVSAAPARSVDPYTDGARVGKADPYTDGAIA